MALFIAVMLWWTFAVMVMALLVSATDVEKPVDMFMIVGMAVFWPITAVLAIISSIYRSLVLSTKQIRVDLKNRELLRKFEEWVKTQDIN